MRIEFKNVNTNKLHDELINSGIIPSLVESLDSTTWVTVEDSQYDAVLAIVAVHSSSPIPQKASELDLLKTQLKEAQDQQLLNKNAINYILMNY